MAGIVAGLAVGIALYLALSDGSGRASIAQTAVMFLAFGVAFYGASFLHDRVEHRYGRHCGMFKHPTPRIRVDTSR